MSIKATALKRMLIAGAALGGLVVSASPAAADFFELQYSTGVGSGDIFFTILPTGTHTGAISHIAGAETVTSGINDANVKQTVTGPAAVGAVPAQVLLLTGIPGGPNNDNLLINGPTPPTPYPTTSTSAGSWFTTGGLAFVAADGTLVDLYDAGGKLREYAIDTNGNVASGIASSATLTDLGAPGPVPGNGVPALVMLGVLALTAKFRGRFVR
jgi:hypothetical protein